MLDSLFSSTVTGAFGGVIGAIGGLLSKYLEHKQAIEVAKIDLEKSKIQSNHELQMADKQNAALQLELTANVKVASIEAEVAFDNNAVDALKAAYENDKATYATGDEAKNSKWFIAVDFLRGVTRPLLTWLLDLAVLIITIYLLYILSDQLPNVLQKEGVTILVNVVNTILFLASTATSYWYSSRSHTGK